VRPLPPQLSQRLAFVPRDEDTAAAKGNTGVAVVSTVSLILMIEEACGRLVGPYLEAGEATVGVRVAVDHLAPARVGRPVDVTASLAGVDGRRLAFAAELVQDGRRVMAGTHDRMAVDLARFLGSPSPAPAPGPAVEFWFDVHSPWCYLAAHRIGGIVRAHGGTVRWRPIHLANLIAAIGGRRPLEENPAFVAWYRQDLLDHAALQGLPLAYHPAYPLRPSRALRACFHAAELGAGEPFALAVLRAYWAEGRDISDVDVLSALAEGVGLEGQAAARATADPRLKDAIEANGREAVAKGLFGVPTAVLDGRLFFGNDRLDLLDRALATTGRQQGTR